MRPRSPLKVSPVPETYDDREAKPSITRSPELDALYRRYARSVARWAYLLGGPAVEPEDVMQEVFLVAHRELATLREGVEAAGTAAWLRHLTLNVVRNRRRKERTRAALQRLGAFTGLVPEAPPEPIRELERKETSADVYRLLGRMRERHRTVLILFEIEGLSGEEIAQALGVKTSTVWVWLHRARAQFLKLQAAVEDEP